MVARVAQAGKSDARRIGKRRHLVIHTIHLPINSYQTVDTTTTHGPHRSHHILQVHTARSIYCPVLL